MVIGGLSSDLFKESALTFLYDHEEQKWSDGPFLITGREYAKAGVVVDEGTMEKLVIVTGGKGGWSGGSLATTEILMDNQWIQGIQNYEKLEANHS